MTTDGSLAANIVHFGDGDPRYPHHLKLFLGDRVPATLSALGNLNLIRRKKVALFCSAKCPGNLILQTYDLAQKWSEEDVTVISGFHSPMEQECLRILLRGTRPIIICPARSIDGMRIPKEYKEPLAKGKLLLLSPFSRSQRRMTAQSATTRNYLVAALADKVFVPHAAPQGKTEVLCRTIIGWGKPLYTLTSDYNANLVSLGAKTVSPGAAAEMS